jgi:hypothetical protein
MSNTIFDADLVVGCTVTSFTKVDNYGVTFPVIEFQTIDGQKLFAYISRDDEMNGSGSFIVMTEEP